MLRLKPLGHLSYIILLFYYDPREWIASHSYSCSKDQSIRNRKLFVKDFGSGKKKCFLLPRIFSIHLCQDDDPVILWYLYRIKPTNELERINYSLHGHNQLLPSWSHSYYRMIFRYIFFNIGSTHFSIYIIGGFYRPRIRFAYRFFFSSAFLFFLPYGGYLGARVKTLFY